MQSQPFSRDLVLIFIENEDVKKKSGDFMAYCPDLSFHFWPPTSWAICIFVVLPVREEVQIPFSVSEPTIFIESLEDTAGCTLSSSMM